MRQDVALALLEREVVLQHVARSVRLDDAAQAVLELVDELASGRTGGSAGRRLRQRSVAGPVQAYPSTRASVARDHRPLGAGGGIDPHHALELDLLRRLQAERRASRRSSRPSSRRDGARGRGGRRRRRAAPSTASDFQWSARACAAGARRGTQQGRGHERPGRMPAHQPPPPPPPELLPPPPPPPPPRCELPDDDGAATPAESAPAAAAQDAVAPAPPKAPPPPVQPLGPLEDDEPDEEPDGAGPGRRDERSLEAPPKLRNQRRESPSRPSASTYGNHSSRSAGSGLLELVLEVARARTRAACAGRCPAMPLARARAVHDAVHASRAPNRTAASMRARTPTPPFAPASSARIGHVPEARHDLRGQADEDRDPGPRSRAVASRPRSMRARQLAASARPRCRRGAPRAAAGRTDRSAAVERARRGDRRRTAPPASASSVGSQTGSRRAGGPASASALSSTPGGSWPAGSKPVFS